MGEQEKAERRRREAKWRCGHRGLGLDRAAGLAIREAGLCDYCREGVLDIPVERADLEACMLVRMELGWPLFSGPDGGPLWSDDFGEPVRPEGRLNPRGLGQVGMEFIAGEALLEVAELSRWRWWQRVEHWKQLDVGQIEQRLGGARGVLVEDWLSLHGLAESLLWEQTDPLWWVGRLGSPPRMRGGRRTTYHFVEHWDESWGQDGWLDKRHRGISGALITKLVSRSGGLLSYEPEHLWMGVNLGYAAENEAAHRQVAVWNAYRGRRLGVLSTWMTRLLREGKRAQSPRDVVFEGIERFSPEFYPETTWESLVCGPYIYLAELRWLAEYNDSPEIEEHPMFWAWMIESPEAHRLVEKTSVDFELRRRSLVGEGG